MGKSDMTWNEFKEHVDKQLEEQGISPDERIWYMDFSFPPSLESQSERSFKYLQPQVTSSNTGLGIAVF